LALLLPFWPLVQTLGRGLTVGSPRNSSAPPSLGRDRSQHQACYKLCKGKNRECKNKVKIRGNYYCGTVEVIFVRVRHFLTCTFILSFRQFVTWNSLCFWFFNAILLWFFHRLLVLILNEEKM